jgi:5-methylcytosine-specific restriction protein A
VARSRPKGRLSRYGYIQQKARLVKEQFEEFGYNFCVGCGKSFAFDKAVNMLELDHIKSRARGGTDDPENLRLVCHTCHVKKTGYLGARPVDDNKMEETNTEEN